MLERAVRLTLPRHQQQFLRSRAPRLGPRLHPTLHDLDHQRTFLAVPHVDPGPGVLRQSRAPSIQSQEWAHGMSPTTHVFRGWHVKVTDQGVRRHRQQETLATALQFPAKTRGTAHLIVSGYPAVWQSFPALVKHLQGELVTGAELDFLGHPRRFATGAVFRPFLVKVQTCIYERMSLPRDISHEDADLAVVNFAKPAAPLLRDAHRLGPFLGKCRRVENDHRIGLAEVFADL